MTTKNRRTVDFSVERREQISSSASSELIAFLAGIPSTHARPGDELISDLWEASRRRQNGGGGGVPVVAVAT